MEETLRLRDDLSNMIIHDMRNPLAAILLYSQLLMGKVASPDVLKCIETVHAEAQHLNSFVDDMLMLAKMEHGKLLLSRSWVDVNQIALEVEGHHGAIAASRGMSLVLDLPRESHRVSLDANLFRRVLDNLLSNALKFSPAESTVTLRVEYPRARAGSQSQEPAVRIQVLDEGPGIPEEYRETIFDKFEVAALKQKGVSQVGLGLAFCKMVAEAHRGRIFVEANEPKGSVFTVEC
jgi:two-component system sensor histidine kinase/response regulator